MRNIIKKIILKLILIIGKFCSFVYSYKTSQYLRIFKVYIYSAYISKEFNHVGKGTIISYLSSLSGGKNISIGNYSSIGKMSVINAWTKYENDTFNPKIIIGNNVKIGSESHISAINYIKIGDNVLTGKKVTITDNSHGKSTLLYLNIPPANRSLFSDGAVIIEDGVWIGDKVTILPNVRIGENSIIGANAVVTKDIPANCVAAGVPAKVIKIIK